MENRDIRPVLPEETEELIGLWRECFQDSEDYIRLFMKRNLPEIGVWVITKNREIAGAVYLLPATVREGKNEQAADMVYAVGVKKKYRGRGLMKILLTALSEKAGKEGRALFLKPANEKLMHYYESLGFRQESAWSLIPISPVFGEEKALFTPLTAEEYGRMRAEAFSDKAYVSWSTERLAWVIEENIFCGGWAEKMRFRGKDYAILSVKDQGELTIMETTAPLDVIEALSGQIAEHCHAEHITLICEEKTGTYPKELASMSIHAEIKNPYVNLILL